jgi:putative membrane protein
VPVENDASERINVTTQNAALTTPALTTTELANQRTDLALLRTRMAADRTLMAWVRTALSMISFGFTIYKFLQYVRESEGVGLRAQGPRNFGLALILLGTGGLAAASIQHRQLLKVLSSEKTKHVWSLSLTIASIILLIGLAAFLSVLTRVGPF